VLRLSVQPDLRLAPHRVRRGGALLVILTVCLSLAPRAAHAQDECLACHGNAAFLTDLTADSARGKQLAVDQEAFAVSVHGRMQFSCTLCHASITGYPHEVVEPVACGGCHSSEHDELANNVHGRSHPATGTPPATCADCHTNHHILGADDPESSVYHLTQFLVCARCHSDAATMARFGHRATESVRTYLNSVHGRGLIAKGLVAAPSCTDCHGGDGAHDIETVESNESPVRRDHVAATCGRCHVGILRQYSGGIHGTTFADGNTDAPTCTDCHLEHGVQPITSPSSSVYPTHIAQTCTACHDREDLNVRYDIPSSRGSTFSKSFHGIALESGQLTVANCESCHGAHGILPSSDPRSKVHSANLVETCGTCHSGIGEGVVTGKIHVRSLREDVNTLAWAVQWFYYVLIAGIIVYAAGMIFLDQYRRRVVDKRKDRQHE